YRGRDAERDHVGQAVELDAELARGARRARHASVESVAKERDHNHHGRDFEMPGHRRDHRVEARQQADRRDRRGQQINAAPERAVGTERRLATAVRIDYHPQARVTRASGVAAHCSIAPMTDSPARTRWPVATVTRYSDGKK